MPVYCPSQAVGSADAECSPAPAPRTRTLISRDLDAARDGLRAAKRRVRDLERELDTPVPLNSLR